MAAPCLVTSDGSGFQRALKRAPDLIQFAQRSEVQRALKRAPDH